MKILLFNVTVRATVSRSLGVYRIAHYLRDHGLDVEVIDWANHWSLAQLKELYLSRDPENISLIGFSHLFSNTWSSLLDDFCNWTKSQTPGLKIIAGATSLPLYLTTSIDYYVQGFGEHAAVALVEWLIGNGSKPKFSLRQLNNAKLIEANENYQAWPMRSLMVKYQDRDFVESQEWLSVEFSRGCKFHCDFCNFPVLGVKGDHSRDADDFKLQMLDAYDRFGVTNYLVSDETFNDRTDKITKFADVVETLPFDPWFSGYLRADLMISRGVTEWHELARMGFRGQFYGIESFNTTTGQSIGKGMNSKKLQDGLLEIRKYFENTGLYRGTISLIAGLPYETFETLWNTQQWLINNWQGQSFLMFNLDIPKPNGRLKTSKFTEGFFKNYYKEVEVCDKNSNDPWYQMFLKNITAQTPDIVPNLIGKKDVVNWQTEDMNIDQAIAVSKAFVAMKENLDFRTEVFALGAKFKNSMSLAELLELKHREYVNQRSDDFLNRYIQKKLSL